MAEQTLPPDASARNEMLANLQSKKTGSTDSKKAKK